MYNAFWTFIFLKDGMGVKSDLAQFYSKNAAHYHQTRQKFRVD